MSGKDVFSNQRITCPNFFKTHKKAVYFGKRMNFKKVGDHANSLQKKFPSILISSADLVCSNCYKKIIDQVQFDDQSVCDETNSETDAKEVLNVESEDEFQIELSESIHDFNSQILKNLCNISPLKQKGKISSCSSENYVAKKTSQIYEATNSKLQKYYDVEPTKVNDEIVKNYQTEWSQNFSKALENCLNIQEKIRLLTLLPQSFSKFDILAAYPKVTPYMIDASRKLIKSKGIYSKPDNYMGAPLSKEIVNIVLNYYTDDDYNCSRQSPNKSDVVTINTNGIKEKKVKRFLTRSLKEVYCVCKTENPTIKIGKTKFYSLRPKFVCINHKNNVCLCIYCANFELLITGLMNFRKDKYSELENIRSGILSGFVCRTPKESCFFRECPECVDSPKITLTFLKLDDLDDSEEITFAAWNKGDLEKKTLLISVFLQELIKSGSTAITHFRVKDIQRKAIKEAKECALLEPNHLLMHVDFAENWAVVLKKSCTRKSLGESASVNFYRRCLLK